MDKYSLCKSITRPKGTTTMYNGDLGRGASKHKSILHRCVTTAHHDYIFISV